MHAILDIAPPHPGLISLIDEGLARVERRFAEHLQTASPSTADLCRHIEQYRGKMLRPALVLLSGMASAPDRAITEAHITVAAVIEMIHMATLVHDDVLDGGDRRRGAPTVNARYGRAAAVTLGDYLFARSFHLCATLESQSTSQRIGEVTAIVCEGEILQNALAGRFDLSEATYFEIIERKTAALIGASCELGAFHSGADDPIVDRLSAFGLKIGTAFQIQDDLLDLVGDAAVVGKTLGRDLDAGKLTLPLIHCLAALPDQRRRTLIRGITDRPDESIVDELQATGSICYARDVAARLVAQARALLAPLPESDARTSLLAMAQAVITREM